MPALLPRLLSAGAPLPLARSFASRPSAAVATDLSEQDWQAARAWSSKLNVHTIPRNICDVSFSRSSGPGGQNVNKVNSKALVKVPLGSLLPLVPRVLHPHLQSSPYATHRSQNLIIQSDDSRNRANNVESCFEKLYQLLKRVADETIPGETSPEKKDRVRKLQKTANEVRIKSKKLHSSKKSARRSNKSDE